MIGANQPDREGGVPDSIPPPENHPNAAVAAPQHAGAIVSAYEMWAAGQPIAMRTRQAYTAAAVTFVAWLMTRQEGIGSALATPDARDLAAQAYHDHLIGDRGLSPATVSQTLAALNYLFRSVGLGAAIVRRAPRSRIPPRTLSRGEQRALWRAADESTARDRAILALLLLGGLRLSEVAALEIDDMQMSSTRGIIVVRSRDHAKHEIALSVAARRLVTDWSRERAAIAADGETSLFVSRTGRALQTRSVDLAVRRVAERAELSFSAQVLRNTFVKGLVRDPP